MRRLLVVALLIELGLLLMVIPWSAYWERNYFAQLSPVVNAVITNNYIRGAITGLGAVNLLFWLTANTIAWSGFACSVASTAFVIGAVAMPICCVVMAHFPKLHLIFAVPVLSLLAGGGLTLLEVAKL